MRTVSIEISAKTFAALEREAEKLNMKPDLAADAAIRHCIRGEIFSEAAARVMEEVKRG